MRIQVVKNAVLKFSEVQNGNQKEIGPRIEIASIGKSNKLKLNKASGHIR
jgi:hypothetical protein